MAELGRVESSTSSSPTPTTMFKSILPSRRVPSGDFTFITPLADDVSGKENLPSLAARAQMPLAKGRTVTKGFIQTSEMKKKTDHKKPKDSPSSDSTVVSTQAFDKLLVSSIHFFTALLAVHFL